MIDEEMLATLLEAHAKAIRSAADSVAEVSRGLHDIARSNERLVEALRLTPPEPVAIRSKPVLQLVDSMLEEMEHESAPV